MQQNIAAKLQIIVNPLDKQILHDTMKAYSNACNYVSDYIYKTHNLSRYNDKKILIIMFVILLDYVLKWQHLVYVQ